MTALQNFVSQYGFGISKKELVSKAYSKLTLDGHDCYIINDIYIAVDGNEYQIIKSRKNGGWMVKAF